MTPKDEINGNGKQRWGLGIVGVLSVALLTWNFSAVYSLQLASGLRDEKVLALRAEFDAQRASDLAFRPQIVSQVEAVQTEMRRVIAAGQDETRASIAKVTEILTGVRIELSAQRPATVRSGPK